MAYNRAVEHTTYCVHKSFPRFYAYRTSCRYRYYWRSLGSGARFSEYCPPAIWGNDAAIQSDMATIQTQAEIYYGGAGAIPYGPAQAWTAGTATGDPLAGGSVSCATGMFSDTTIKKALAAADLVNGTFEVGCAAVASGSLTGYVAAAQLTSVGGGVDHTGVGRRRRLERGRARQCR